MAREDEYRKDKLKAQPGLYVPRASEYEKRAQTYAEKKAKGLIKENPGVTTPQGKKFVKQLEELTGEKQNKIGSYTEAPGGGTPLARGTKAPSDEWVKEHRQMQPRDPNTGQFEYNNANAKGTKYPSRGEKTPMFIEGEDFDMVFNKIKDTEHTIITDEGKTAIARLDMTAGEFKEAIKNASEKLGFTTRWNVENKKGRKSAAEKEALAKGEKGRIGGGMFKYSNDLSKGQERAIAASDADESKYKGDLESMNLTKQYQKESKEKEHDRSKARNNRDKELNAAWESGDIDDEMIAAVKDIYPVKEFDTKDPEEVVQKIMDMKDKNGKPRFKNFEEFRHWTLGNRNKGWL